MKLSNTIKLLPDIWKNKTSIIEGIKNKTFQKQDIEDLAEYRHSICSSCIWNTKHYKSYEDVPEVIKEVKDESWIIDCIKSNSEKCLYCSCNVSLDNSIKLRSLSANCPLPEPAWEEVVDSDLQEDVYRVAKNNLK
jgi:hypothetical protein